MIELTDYANTRVPPCDSRDPFMQCQHEMFARSLGNIKRLLPAHDAEIREQAMREQMEADCKAICEDCRAGFWPRGPRKASWSMHERRRNGRVESQRTCDAYVIRRVFAKAEQERKGGAA